MNVSENFMVMVNMAILFFVTYWVVKSYLDWRRFRHQLDLHHKLIDKFANVQELAEFLQTPNGSKLITVTSAEKLYPARERMMGAISKSTITTFLGGAFLLIANMYQGEEHKVFTTMAIIAIALGLAFLVSTVTSFILSKKWGIIKED